MKYKRFKIFLFSIISSIIIIVLISLLTVYFHQPLFRSPTSTVLFSSNGRLMNARIADDEQWRFPLSKNVSEKFTKAILLYEDKRFYQHVGIDIIALGRALYQNIKARSVVSGASTLTMQVARLSYGNKKRTFWQKIKEAFLTIGIELTHSKKEILALYAANAPFGGNVVGLDAASWRYYGVPVDNLSWADIATLTVLPNAPALIHLSKNRDLLKQKRDEVLKRLFEDNHIDTIDYQLAIKQPLPDKPYALPNLTPHLTNHAIELGQKGKNINTTIDYNYQIALSDLVNRYGEMYKNQGVYNAGAIIVETETQKVVAYVGNTEDRLAKHENHVNIITAPRSSGSTLKPFLFACMLQDGELLPQMLIPDIPTTIAGYTPKNFKDKYAGMVPADKVLTRSLNIPMVRMLYNYGLTRFYHHLKQMNFSTINKPSEYYGLSIILGGAEVTLWDLVGAYASLGNGVLNYDNQKKDQHIVFSTPYFLENQKRNHVRSQIQTAASYQTLEVLSALHRPNNEIGWEQYTSSQKVAWKTGTSFGFRDAWAIGVTPKYTIGVWVGNATGEGKPELSGVKMAAPILFDAFKLLGNDKYWFSKPLDELYPLEVCEKSGFRKSRYCPKTKIIYSEKMGKRSQVCPFHQMLHLDDTEQFRVNSLCYPAYRIKQKSWFILPQVIEWYYTKNHPEYRRIPPLHPDCSHLQQEKNMDIVYPDVHSKLFIPIDLDGKPEKIVFKATHRNKSSVIFWYLDKIYIGSTSNNHELSIRPKKGKHQLLLVDHLGNRYQQNIEVDSHYDE